MSNKTEYAYITVHYNSNVFKSIGLDITNDEDNRELVTIIADIGTSKLTMFKMPTGTAKFLVFSREQLDRSLFEIEIKSKTKTVKKKTKTEMITS